MPAIKQHSSSGKISKLHRLAHIGLSAVFFLLASPVVIGQCATGVNTGGGNCVPPNAAGMPGYNNENSQIANPPAPVWLKQWGAIVIDSQTGGAGTVTGRDSKSDAIRDATTDCESHGAKTCKVALTYYNQCAAIAWGDGGYGVAGNADESMARGDAMRYCSENGSSCKVVYTACSTARRIK